MTDPCPAPSVLPPRVFWALESFCKEALLYGSNHPALRRMLQGLCLELSLQSINLFGVDATDVVSLKKLVERTDPKNAEARPAVRRDPIQELEYQRLITVELVSSANIIQDIWKAFGRYLVISGRQMESSGKRGKPLQPLDVMGQRVYDVWKERYIPWFKQARYAPVRAHRQVRVNEAILVLEVVVEGNFPEEVDLALSLSPGTTLEVLRKQLGLFNDPK